MLPIYKKFCDVPVSDTAKIFKEKKAISDYFVINKIVIYFILF